jgi:hypothetical protein
MTFYHFFFVILVWEMQKMQKKVSPSGKYQKKCKNMTPNPGNTKKMQKMQKQCKQKTKKNKKNDSCAGKMTFLDFLGRLWVQPPALDEKTTKKTTRK